MEAIRSAGRRIERSRLALDRSAAGLKRQVSSIRRQDRAAARDQDSIDREVRDSSAG